MDLETKAYYDGDPEGYAASTIGGDVSDLRGRFSSLLAPGARVLDLGCGSGRDALAFTRDGFDVTAVDGSEGMCSVASVYTGVPVRCLDFMELDYEGEFDGVWACASLLHLRPEELPTALSLVHRSLVDGGVLCMSFKRGGFSGRRDGRWYTDLEPDRMEMLAEDPGITKKREETQQAIVYLDEAIEKINYMQASGDLERGEE